MDGSICGERGVVEGDRALPRPSRAARGMLGGRGRGNKGVVTVTVVVEGESAPKAIGAGPVQKSRRQSSPADGANVFI